MNVDTVCTLAPYFRIRQDKVEQWRELAPQFVERARTEPGCLHYAFSFDGVNAHCREGYADATALLAHLDNVGDLLQRVLRISEMVRFEVHAPDDQIALLRQPMEELDPQFFTLTEGFRR
ncbi:putative quinol monooxygenase [Granulicoccus sp. GXG6511]|uniref:putative quinol monooxygenase n=1 Tax=Granulicoccus sp. GXG6511 TaxID=3381351 RepID=UPI003D7CA72F